jgi:FeS assembly SUF system protein
MYPFSKDPSAPPAAASSTQPEPRPPITPDPLATLKLKPHIIEALSTVYDPEIPVNIYELGLIYDILVDAASAVEIRMTLTAPACPAAQILPGEVERKVRSVPGVTDVRVEIVWDPPWGRERMSEAARLQLGLL